jgi:type II secretory pathway component PulJ
LTDGGWWIKNMNRLKGFTLIETLIYIGIFSIVALSLSGILWNTLQINSNQQAANEVDENLRYVMSVLNEKVRGSTAIVATTTPGV